VQILPQPADVGRGGRVVARKRVSPGVGGKKSCNSHLVFTGEKRARKFLQGTRRERTRAPIAPIGKTRNKKIFNSSRKERKALSSSEHLGEKREEMLKGSYMR